MEYYAFPTVEALSQATEENLRDCGLGYRAKYIAVTARTIASGEISLEKIYDMRYHQAKKELMKLCGVGEKVAECICLFALHHMDAFPIDTHIRQVMPDFIGLAADVDNRAPALAFDEIYQLLQVG